MLLFPCLNDVEKAAACRRCLFCWLACMQREINLSPSLPLLDLSLLSELLPRRHQVSNLLSLRCHLVSESAADVLGGRPVHDIRAVDRSLALDDLSGLTVPLWLDVFSNNVDIL